MHTSELRKRVCWRLARRDYSGLDLGQVTRAARLDEVLQFLEQRPRYAEEGDLALW